MYYCFFFFQAEDGIRDLVRSRGLGDVYKRQHLACVLTVADADAAAVVKADPGGAAGRVDQRIQNLSLIHI